MTRATHVLVVDDEPYVSAVVARLVKRALKETTVDTAASPDEALAKLQSVTADARVLVVSDYNMGASLNGIQLLAEIARRRPDARRVLMSGYARSEFEAELAGAPLDAVVAKPMDFQEFAALVQGLLPAQA